MNKIMDLIYDFTGWLNQNFGTKFIRVQTWLFGFLIAGTILDSFRQVVAGQLDLIQLRFLLVRLGIVWVISLFSLTFFWIVALRLNLDLWFYYFVWVKLAVETKIGKTYYKWMYGAASDSIYERIRDIYDSQQMVPEGFITQKGGTEIDKKYPSFIQREHLDRKNFWPHWVFSIVTIFNQEKIKIIVDQDRIKKNWTLEVDLKDEPFGIYSSRGKKFLSTKYREAINHFKQISVETQSHLMPSASIGKYNIAFKGPMIPMRWASGGYLGIVKYRHKYWASLFFRDIPPIGLNVANGASENKDEYKSINKLIGREFSEETILLPTVPKLGLQLRQINFESLIPSTEKSTHNTFLSTAFTVEHAKLRQKHDHFKIFIQDSTSDQENGKRRLKSLETPFRVKVLYHRPDRIREEGSELVEFIIPSINPRETGIETIWLCAYHLYDGEYLIDGEYDLSRNILIRRPIILIDMEYLETLYRKNNSLGSIIDTEENFEEDKRLPELTSENFVLFDVDVDLRIERLKRLKEIKGRNSKNEIANEYDLSYDKALDALNKESHLIQDWLRDYEYAFKSARDTGTLSDPRLRSLCPVTWKTLELIFAHKIKYKILN